MLRGRLINDATSPPVLVLCGYMDSIRPYETSTWSQNGWDGKWLDEVFATYCGICPLTYIHYVATCACVVGQAG